MTIRLHSDLSGTISENSRVAATTRRGETDRGDDDEAWKKRVDETVMTDDSARFGKYRRQLDELSAAITQLHREGRKKERRKGR